MKVWIVLLKGFAYIWLAACGGFNSRWHRGHMDERRFLGCARPVEPVIEGDVAEKNNFTRYCGKGSSRLLTHGKWGKFIGPDVGHLIQY